MIDDIKKKQPFFIFSLIIISLLSISYFNNAFALDVNQLQLNEYYQFNQTAGTTIIDNCKYTPSSHCINNDIAATNGASCQFSGLLDLSCFVEGSNNRMQSLQLPNNYNYTVNGWVWRDNYYPGNPQDTGQNYLFTSSTQGSNVNAIRFDTSNTRDISFAMFSGTGTILISQSTPEYMYGDQHWQMITLQVIKTNTVTYGKLWINATKVSVFTANTTSALTIPTGQTVTMGNRVGGGGGIQDFSCKCYFDEWAVFNSTLTQSQITTLYNSGLGFPLIHAGTQITLTPNQGPKGSSVIINGSGFSSTVSTNLYYDGVFFDQILSNNGDGTFSKTITIPSSSIGTHVINATEQSPAPAKNAIAAFKVTANYPKITLTPINAKVGSSVSVSGSGFVNQSPLSFKLDSKVLSTSPGLPTTDSNGNFTNVSFIVPQTIAGHHNINVTDGSNNNATAILNATSNEVIVPDSGIVGTTVTVNGYGFSASSSININFDSKLVGTGTTNTNGTFLNSKIRVPSSTVNAHVISSMESLIGGCTATGGTITNSGDTTIHTFTSNGTFTVTSGSCNAKVLVVGGGGSGGSTSAGTAGGGGGAGGFINITSYAISTGAYNVIVGKGGTQQSPSNNGNNGTDSFFDLLKAFGGGGGAADNDGVSYQSGRNGGSGGGGAYDGIHMGGTSLQTSNNGGTGHGFRGGNGTGGTNYSSGGGGGAGGKGGNSGVNGGIGGIGLSSSINGTSLYYACGGGGGSFSGTSGSSGCASAGAGGNSAGTNGGAATANTGSGGGGGGAFNAGSHLGGAGGSGIVIISYMGNSNGKHSASTTFNTIPSLSVIPSNGKTGSIIILNGSGFSGSSQIHVSFGGSAIITNPPFFITNSTGSFNNIKINVPSVALGDYIIQAVDTGSHHAEKTFTVTAFSSIAPDPVSTLHSTFINNTAVGLAWSQPNLHKNVLSGYQINYTTPFGIPQTIITNNTLSSNTQFTITGLTSSTNYSFRVGIWTTNSSNPYGNVLDITTTTPFTPQNFTLGSVGTTSNGNINATNTLKVPIAFQRQDFGTTTILKVIYQNNFNLACNMFYEFAQVNRTYNNLPSTPYDAGFVQTIFNFNNTVNDVIKVNCKDIITGTEGRYVITQTNFPIKQQVDNFRNGTYGTHGQFGSYDLITLAAIILSMIGLNRLNEAVGAFFTIALIGVLGYFHIIEWQTILISVIALIVMLAVTQTRKD